MSNSVAVYLPTRKGSQRVSGKNTRCFAGNPEGIIGIKIRQALQIQGVQEIILSTDDPATMEIARQIDPDGARVKIVERPARLCQSDTLVEDLINYVPETTGAAHILWLHATTPFVQPADYERALQQYFQALDQQTHDSVLSVTRYQKFLWSDEEHTIINCDRTKNKWPNTQDLKPLYEINHAFYIAPRTGYLRFHDRIGERPLLFELSAIQAFDIDWEDDFLIAEAIHERVFNR